MNSHQRFAAALKGEPTDRLLLMPITMMFAADRIGRPYGEYARDYRVMAEGQLRTAEEFGFDQVSSISDPAREAADCGANICWFADQPPAIREDDALLADKRALKSLKRPDPLGGGRMHDRVKAVELLASRVGQDRLVEGWVEGPCAQGADLRGINTLMLDFYDDEPFIRDLFGFIVEMEVRFAQVQKDAGASYIGIGDAAASLVGPEIYERFVWPYEKKIVDAIHALGLPVRLHICGNTTPLLRAMGKLGCEIVDLDYPSSMELARQQMPPTQLLTCNIDPVRDLRNGTPQSIHDAIATRHQQVGSYFIVGAGCEVPRDTKLENVRAMADYALTHRS